MADENIGLRFLNNIGDMLLHIEIDTDLWVGRSPRQKLKYLKDRITDKNGNKFINVGTNLLESMVELVKTSSTSPVIKRYASVAELALNLGKTSLVLNNLFVSQKYEVHTDYDDLAKFMGYKNGQSINVEQIDATPEICKSLLEMTPEAQRKYGVSITKVSTNTPNNLANDQVRFVTTYMLLKFRGRNVGLEVNYMFRKNKDTDLTVSSSASFVNIGVTHTDLFIEGCDENVHQLIESIIYSNYIDSIDVSKNLIKIDGTTLHTEPRQDINFELHNIDLDDMAKTCRAVLDKKIRRGYLLQGDPGTGKTVSIHKLLMQFTDVPVFWISSDAISDATRLSSVFRILNMFPGSIFVFDDIDGNDLSRKTNLTTKFITCVDETNSAKFSGVLILIINDPQRIDSTIKTRNGRIDEVIHVKNPETTEQVIDVVNQRFVHMGMPIPDWVSLENADFVNAIQRIIDSHMTHAHITGIVNDMVNLSTGDYDCGTFASLIAKREESIKNASMVTDGNGHIVPANQLKVTFSNNN